MGTSDPPAASPITLPNQRRLLPVAAGVIFALGLGLSAVRITPASSAEGLGVAAPWVLTDFRAAVYYPARAFLDGANPYNSKRYLARYPAGEPFPLYLPATLILGLPFALLPQPLAGTTYLVLTVALTLFLAWAVLRLAGFSPRRAAIIAVAGAILLSRPGHWNLLSGQVTIPIVLGVYMSLALAQRRPPLAGIGLAISLLKPTFGLPLIPLLLAGGARRAVIYGLALSAALNLPIVFTLMRQEGGVSSFLDVLIRDHEAFAAQSSNDPALSTWRVDLSAGLSRVQGAPLKPIVEGALALGILGLASLAIGRLKAFRRARDHRVIAGLVCCALLLSLYHQAYDLLLLTLPAVQLVVAWTQRDASRAVLCGQGVLFCVLAVNYVATEWLLAAVRPTASTRLAILSINCLVLLALFALYLIEAVRQPSRSPQSAAIGPAG